MTGAIECKRPASGRAGRIVASLGGIGHCPIAPGTLASLVALGTGLLIMRAGVAALPEAVLAATSLGLLAIERSGAAQNDPGWIVIDELAGQWLAMLALPQHPSLGGLVAAFVLFRLLDVVKPGPIGWVDRRHNAAAVMGDDLIAGALAGAALWLADWFWPRLLG